MGVPAPKPGFLGMLPLYAKKGIIGMDLEMTEKYGRVSGIFHGRIPALLISDAEMIKQIFVEDFSKFVNRNRFVPSVNMMKKAVSNVENEEWKYMRSIITPTFSSAKMREMCSSINLCCDRLVKKLASKIDPDKAIKLDELCQSYTMDVIAATSFGLDIDSHNNPDNSFFKNAKRTLNFSFSLNIIVLCMMFPFLTDILDYLNIGHIPKDSAEYFINVVNQALDDRKADSSTRRDFLQLMMNAQKENSENSGRGLTKDEVLANSLFFIMAGFDTTSLTIAFTLHCIAIHPEVQERAFREIQSKLGERKPNYDNVKELEYLDMIISETLRLYPPATRLNRRANCDTTVKGLFIPKSMVIMIPLYTLHRDPEYWIDPEDFNPERFSPENKHTINPYAYMPFGAGPRNCVGIRLANLVTKIAIVTLLQNFQFIQTPETEVKPKLATGGFVRPQNGTWLQVRSR
ncbi:hypothetical protein LOTGIDRAFT_160658 [Lottia gigantea]|uniref:Uncharacterized protein n=1 Tax=Lottia gigantea TaxID=225164 RepID=V4APE5_LOTGI|nr:hypothetical protein LOTGIDRAFT_160658 [Lottia gigantea]ESO95501.1 hypothetical protein LOTGIDRAFT_160658 [Lottia gigantea]